MIWISRQPQSFSAYSLAAKHWAFQNGTKENHSSGNYHLLKYQILKVPVGNLAFDSVQTKYRIWKFFLLPLSSASEINTKMSQGSIYQNTSKI